MDVFFQRPKKIAHFWAAHLWGMLLGLILIVWAPATIANLYSSAASRVVGIALVVGSTVPCLHALRMMITRRPAIGVASGVIELRTSRPWTVCVRSADVASISTDGGWVRVAIRSGRVHRIATGVLQVGDSGTPPDPGWLARRLRELVAG